jgi:chromosome segregation ATPase
VEVKRLADALEDATSLLRENAEKWRQFSEQLERAEETIERLTNDNKELRGQLKEKEEIIGEKAEKVDVTSKEFSDMARSKEAQIDKLRSQLTKKEVVVLMSSICNF